MATRKEFFVEVKPEPETSQRFGWPTELLKRRRQNVGVGHEGFSQDAPEPILEIGIGSKSLALAVDGVEVHQQNQQVVQHQSLVATAFD